MTKSTFFAVMTRPAPFTDTARMRLIVGAGGFDDIGIMVMAGPALHFGGILFRRIIAVVAIGTRERSAIVAAVMEVREQDGPAVW
jgi:hypothetical protein